MGVALVHSHRTHGRRGFTLVELLVVMGIVAVLLGILLPVIGKAQEQGRSVKCLSNLRRLAAATAMYAGANRGRPPVANEWVTWLPTQPEYGTLAPYVGLPFNPEHYRCPSDKDERVYFNRYLYTYSANAKIFYLTVWAAKGFCPPLPRVANSAEKIMMIDARADVLYAPQIFFVDGYYALSNRHLRKPQPDQHDGLTTTFQSYGGNVLYVDGHAAFYSDGITTYEADHPDFRRRCDPYSR